jgi:hypothetical protein
MIFWIYGKKKLVKKMKKKIEQIVKELKVRISGKEKDRVRSDPYIWRLPMECLGRYSDDDESGALLGD